MLVTHVPDGVFTVDDFLTAAECDMWIRLSEAIGFQEAPVSTEAGARMLKSVRNNDRVMIDDPTRAAALFAQAQPFLPTVRRNRRLCGLNERLRIYKYSPGQRFNWHCDGFYLRPNGEQSQLTLMVYLNEGYRAGETKFDFGDRDLEVKPQRGKLLIFEHQLRHQGATVLEGQKYVLRTDVMFAPPA